MIPDKKQDEVDKKAPGTPQDGAGVDDQGKTSENVTSGAVQGTMERAVVSENPKTSSESDESESAAATPEKADVQQTSTVQPAAAITTSPENAQASPAAAAAPHEGVSPGLIVLQWLTYAFWGWTVLALSFLTTSVVAHIIHDTSGDNFTTYGVAAVLVLLPISYICDSFYSKKEPAKKAGAETIVMVIHAVIFALFGIGALIASVIALVVLFTSSGHSDGAVTALISALIIAAFYAVTFIRTLNPAIVRWIQHWYKMIMLITVGIISLAGLFGPVARERATRDDRLVATELPVVVEGVNEYARNNNNLPTALSQLNFRGGTKQMVDRGLVTYKPEPTPVTRINPVVFPLNGSKPSISPNISTGTGLTFKYQLCVTYKKERTDNSSYGYGGISGDKDADGYSSYLYIYEHPAGDVCYKLKTTDQ
jgi:hypothetical protein